MFSTTTATTTNATNGCCTMPIAGGDDDDDDNWTPREHYAPTNKKQQQQPQQSSIFAAKSDFEFGVGVKIIRNNPIAQPPVTELWAHQQPATTEQLQSPLTTSPTVQQDIWELPQATTPLPKKTTF
uniref:Uncharacterized protein n=1 Tax=Globodera pallida TaxID=36090 RepID=A0A183CGE9_GLOPA